MNKYDLSVLVPARNEMFVAKTVENILRNKRGKTEVIVALDGEWADPGIPAHKDLTVIYFPESIGQRAATNAACRLSKAKYVMKLDAHSALDEGFDVKLMADMQDDWTVIPMMYNLHAFDWVCIGKTPKSGLKFVEDASIKDKGCGHTIYQGPTPPGCVKCGGNMERLLLWQPRFNRRSITYRFDKTLHFQYWGALNERQEGNLVESLSAQGSCFILTREKYWELNICDENHGSWGQQGVEVAMKTWLSGGRLVVNKNTWYSHMFRTQGGDFGFPYPLSGNQVDRAREYSRDLWINNKWDKALPGHDLNWLLNKFSPVPDWEERNEQATPQGKRGIIYYTDNQLKLKYAHAVQNQLRKIGLPIVSASLKPMPHFGDNIHLSLKRGMEAYFQQIIAALEKSTADIVYMCEADVIYHPSHFDFIPPEKDKFYYNLNFWRIRPEKDNLAVHWDAHQVSGLVCYREFLLAWYKKKWEKIQKEGFDRSYEPGGRNSEALVMWQSKYPNIDIRHGNNLTRSKWSIADFRDKSTCKNWQESTSDKILGWDSHTLPL